MSREECNYTVGEIKALVGPLGEMQAEDVHTYAIVIISRTKQKMLVLSNGGSSYARIQLLATAISHEATEGASEGEL